MDGHMSRVFSVQFTPGQDNEFLSGGWDDTVQVLLRLFVLMQVVFKEASFTLESSNPKKIYSAHHKQNICLS